MTLMLTFIFFTQGLAKFSAHSGWAAAFSHWGYPVWFRVTIGVLEVLAAILVLLPRSAPFGAAIIIVIMLGGMGTHLLKDKKPRVTSELLSLTFATVVLVARRKQFATWLPKGA
jgi:uncharacterized membrane protein YphA (DoxX/SURF4 family)